MVEKDAVQENYDVVDDEELVLNETAKKTNKGRGKRFLKSLLIKLIMLLLTLLLSLSVFSVVSFCWADINLQKEVIADTTNVDGLFYTNGLADEEMLGKMQKFVSDLPTTIKDALNDDWAIILKDRVPAELFHTSFIQINDYDTSGMTIGGYTFTQPRTIYINSSLDRDVMYRSFVHEIGHMVSFEFASEHGSAEWEKIYEANMTTFETDPYNLSNEAEFFAACFDLYYNEPDVLKEQSIDAYNFIHKAIQQEVKDDNIFETFFAGCKNTVNTLRVYYYYYIVKR